jgi:hypothetical protein
MKKIQQVGSDKAKQEREEQPVNGHAKRIESGARSQLWLKGEEPEDEKAFPNRKMVLQNELKDKTRKTKRSEDTEKNEPTTMNGIPKLTLRRNVEAKWIHGCDFTVATRKRR